MKELMVKGHNEEVRINSVELVQIINEYRRAESEAIDKNYKILRHSDFMKKIRNELEVLKSLGLNNEGNISLVNYADSKGEERPCFSLNRDGMLQMLNSESVYVRYKTTEYINDLEEKSTKVNTLTSPSNFNNLIEKIDTKTNQLSEYFRPTHKKKLDINKYIKQCLGTNASKENCDKVKEILLTQLGCYKIYDEVPIDILHSSETAKKIFDICYMMSCNNGQIQMNLNV